MTDRPAGQPGGEAATTRAAGCPDCNQPLAWESIFDHWGERWLAVCECGRIDTFFPDRRHPDEQPPEPLVMALQGHRAPPRPASPAWIRLFLNSLRQPSPIVWRYHHEACPACASRARFALLAWPRPDTAAICALCLNCGHAVSEYRRSAADQPEPALEGAEWAPPCPAVKRLRAAASPNRAVWPDADEHADRQDG